MFTPYNPPAINFTPFTPDANSDPHGFISSQVNTKQSPVNNFAPHQGILDFIKNGAVNGAEAPKQGILANLPGAIGEGLGNYAKNVGNDFMDTAKNIGQNFSDIKNTGTIVPNSGGVQGNNTGSATLRSLSDFLTAVFSPVSEAVNPSLQAGVNALANNPTFGKVANGGAGDAVSKAQQAFQVMAQAHPEAAKNFQSALNIGASLAGEGPANVAGETVANAGEGALNSIKSGAESLVKSAPEDVGAQVAQKATDLQTKALADIAPNFEGATNAQKAKLIAKGNVQEGGLTAGRTVAPSALDTSAATELSKLSGYEKATTNLEKYNLALSGARNEAENLNVNLGAEKIAIPKQQVVKVVGDALKKTADESLLLTKSDPAVQNFMRVIKNAATKAEGTLKGVMDIKHAITQAYENARGSLAFNSDKVAPLDALNKAANDAIKKFAIEHSPNVNIKSSLERQFNLYHASDALLPKAASEAGSKLGRFTAKHPVATKVGKAAIKAAKLGGVVELLH